MHRVWAGMRFIGRWLGPTLIALAAWLFLFPQGPWGDFSALPALIGAIVTAAACAFMRAPERKRLRKGMAAAALLALAFYGWHTWSDGQGFREETVAFHNDGANLVGTLYLPDRKGRYPGMVVLGGSGATPRSFYRPIAGLFARKGFAVLVYDKRGVGDSTGKRDARFFLDVHRDLEPLARDAAAGLAFLAGRPEVRHEAVGFYGISEGGLIAPRAAMLSGRAAYMLMNSSTPGSLFSIVEHQAGSKGLSGKGAEGIRESKRWFGKDFDPMPSLRALDVPSLWIMAGEDTHVSNSASILMLRELQKQGKPVQYQVIPGAWHGLVIAPVKPVWGLIDPWLARVTSR